MNSKGMTLIEVIVVLVILGIIVGIAMPSIIGIIENSKRDVCRANVLQLERMYERYLELEDIEHGDSVFSRYLQDSGENFCPDRGEIRYINGTVYCSLHSNVDDGEDSKKEDGEVPYL